MTIPQQDTESHWQLSGAKKSQHFADDVLVEDVEYYARHLVSSGAAACNNRHHKKVQKETKRAGGGAAMPHAFIKRTPVVRAEAERWLTNLIRFCAVHTECLEWLREHPRFTVTYTPTHASWLNMVEILFSILTRRMLRRGDFASRNDLANKITTFIDTYNGTAKPFRWTYDAKLLRAA